MLKFLPFLPARQRWLLALPLAGLLASPVRAQQATFQPVASYSTGPGSNPQDIAVADVNADGKPDLLTANSGTSTLGVLLGNGNGTFQTPTTYSTGAGSLPSFIAVADVNADGKPDLLTVSSSPTNTTAGVLLGNGNGTFQAIIPVGTGGKTSNLAVADVNGDGKLDLLAANFTPNTVGVLLGNGDGTFQAPTTYVGGANSGVPRLTVADVNTDGKPDILTIETSTNVAGVLLGNGNGTFQALATYGLGSGLYGGTGIAVADVNSDGKPDLLTASDKAGVLLGNGNGTFQPGVAYDAGAGTSGYPADIAAADINGDGRLDLLTANAYSNTVVTGSSGVVGVLLGRNDGTFQNASNLSLGSVVAGPNFYSRRVAVADLNGDGKLDLLFPYYSGDRVAVLLNTTVYAPDLVVTTTTPISVGTYNSITVASPGVGTLAGPVTVSSAVTVASGAVLNDGCYSIDGPGSFTLAAGGTLGICAAQGLTPGAAGAVRVAGLRTYSPDASYTYNGSTLQSTGSALPSQVRNLTTSNPTTLTLTAPTSVTQTLTVSSTGNLLTNNQALTLRSSVSGTALVVNSGTGVVIGGVTVQRYIDPSLNPGLGYRHLAPPVTNSYVGDLTTTGFAPVLNAAYNTAAQPALVQPFPTVFGYDETRLASTTNDLTTFDKGFFSPAALADPLVSGRGYAVNIGGTELVDFVGSLHNGDLTVPLTRSSGTPVAQTGWALLGNPYAAPLDLRLLTAADRTNLSAAFYVYQSTGQYVGGYRSYVNGIGVSPLIASSQGFFVQLTAGQSSGALTFRNAQRVTSFASQATLLRPAADLRPQVQLGLAGAGLTDTFYAYAEAGATPAFDTVFDAVKLPNPSGLNLASVATSGESLAIDGRPVFDAATQLPLTVGVPAAGAYTLGATSLANLPAGLDAYLADALTGQTVRLAPGTNYSFSVSAAQAVSLVTGRFSLLFRPATALATTAPALSAESVSVYPNPARERFTIVVPGLGQASTVQAELLNSLGQVVRRQAAALPATGTQLTLDAAGLAAGVYTLRLQAGATTLAKRLAVQ